MTCKPNKKGSLRAIASVGTFWRHVGKDTQPTQVKLRTTSRWPQPETLEIIEAAKAQRPST